MEYSFWSATKTKRWTLQRRLYAKDPWAILFEAVYRHKPAHYLLVDPKLGTKRLPQWASIYILFFYFSDLTRYRPQHFDRSLKSKYGPQVEYILDECPRQLLYLMASELLKREVTPAAIV